MNTPTKGAASADLLNEVADVLASNNWRGDLQEALRALAASPQDAQPTGYKLVPLEPTPEMMDAAEACSSDWPRTTWKAAWSAMLAAAPVAVAPQAEPQNALKRWPFVESPGVFAERLSIAMEHFPDLLAAVRHVLIEQPPTLAALQAKQVAKAEPVAWMDPNETCVMDAFLWSRDPQTPRYSVPVYAATQPSSNESSERAAAPAEGPAYGIIDPDYGRVYTIVRTLAWQEGYAIGMHGSFTRDLDLIAVPWDDGRRCKPEKLVARILQATGLREQHGNPGIKPHGRKVWTLLFPEFDDPRFVDLSIMPAPAQQATAPTGAENER